MKLFQLTTIGLSSVILLLACSNASQKENAQLKQNKPESMEGKTKLELIQEKRGGIVIKGYTEIGTVKALGNVSVECLELTNKTTGTHEMGIMIDIGIGSRDSCRSFIDYEEIDPLLNGIKYIANIKPEEITKLKNYEANYITRGGFSVVIYNEKSGDKAAAVICAKSSRDGAYLSLNQLEEFQKLIFEAKQILMKANNIVQ